jgi:hypothetical protein
LSDNAGMRTSTWIALASLPILLACPKDDDNPDTGATTTLTTSTTIDPSTTTDETTTDTPAESSSSPMETSTTPAESSGPSDESSTGDVCPPEAECVDDSMCPGGGSCVGCLCIGGNQCDPIIPGEWNSCVDADGNTDNTLCNWMGSGDATGFIGCLNSAGMDGANVCFISGCKDVCDCFAPPVTGTATVTCGEILADGGTGCALDCSGGLICPDGMICSENLCFWPPG